MVIPVFLLGVLGALAAKVVNRFLTPSPLSPVWVTSAVYVGVALFGVLYPGGLPIFAYGTSTLPPELVGRTAVLFMSAAVFLLLGASCYLVLTGTKRRKIVLTPTASWLASPSATNALLLLAATVPTALLVVGSSDGIHTLLHRPDYIDGRTDNAPLFGLGHALALAAVTISGYVYSTARSWITRIASIGVTLLYAIVFFSLASRSIAIAPLAFAFGLYAAAPGSRGSRFTMVIALVLSVTLLALPLYLRTSADHGLFPYLQTLAGHDPNAAPVRWDTPVLNVMSTFGLSGDVAFSEPSIPLSHIWPSVNPLPGSLAGWYEIQPSHRLDVFTPYSAVGELGNYGFPILALYFTMAGAVLAFLETRARDLLSGGYQLSGLGVIALCLLFPVFSLQYQLRADTRILYWALLLLGVTALLRALRGGIGLSSRTVPVSRFKPRGNWVAGSSTAGGLESRSGKPIS